MKFVILVNGKAMNTGGKIYEFETIKEAIKTVNICYDLFDLLRGDVEIKPKEDGKHT